MVCVLRVRVCVPVYHRMCMRVGLCYMHICYTRDEKLWHDA